MSAQIVLYGPHNHSLLRKYFSDQDFALLPAGFDWPYLFSWASVAQDIDLEDGFSEHRYSRSSENIELGLYEHDSYKSKEPLEMEWNFTMESAVVVREFVESLEYNALRIWMAKELMKEVCMVLQAKVRSDEERLNDEQSHLQRIERAFHGTRRNTRMSRSENASRLAKFTLEIISKRVELRKTTIRKDWVQLDPALDSLQALRVSFQAQLTMLWEAERRYTLAQERCLYGKPKKELHLPAEIWYMISEEVMEIENPLCVIKLRDKNYNWRLQRWMISKVLFQTAILIFYKKNHFNMDPISFVGHPMASVMKNITIDFQDMRFGHPTLGCFCYIDVEGVLSQLENCTNIQNLTFLIGPCECRLFIQEAVTKHRIFHPPRNLTSMGFKYHSFLKFRCPNCRISGRRIGSKWRGDIARVAIQKFLLNGQFDTADIQSMEILLE